MACYRFWSSRLQVMYFWFYISPVFAIKEDNNMTEYGERKIKEIENKIDNAIAALNTARCIAIDVPYHVAVYDGKCWNKKIEDEINKKLASTYEGCCLATGYGCDCTFRIFLQDAPYVVPVLYVGNDKSVYTKALNCRINAKDIQEQTEKFVAKCDKMADELRRDKENLPSILLQYEDLLDKTEKVANSVSTFTCNAIQDSNLFQRPVYRFF